MLRTVRTLHATAYFAPAFRYGGPIRSIVGLCSGLQRIGCEVSVFTTTADGPRDLVSGARDYDGIPVTYFERNWPRGLFRAKSMSQALSRCLDEGPPDLVHLHGLWNWTSWEVARLCSRYRCPYILSTRGMLHPSALEHHAFRKKAAYGLYDRHTLTRASGVHVSSEEEATHVRRRVPHLPISVIGNGVVVPENIASAGHRARLGIGPSETVFAFLGRLHPIKRLDLLVDAFSRVSREHEGVRLLVAGPEDGLSATAFMSPQLEGKVRWLGELDEAAKWSFLKEVDALVLCSDSESFGMGALEALAVGVPVIATKSCPWQALEREECGFWVDQDAESLSKAMSRFVAAPDLRPPMARRGKAFAKREFSWDVISRSTADFYRHALAGREKNAGG